MVFTWISVAMMCCPPLLGFNKPIFDREAFICMLDWGNMAAYTITLSILVLGPSVITIIYTYAYIFTTMRRVKSGVLSHDKEYATALSENLSNPSHIISFILVMAFCLSWAPYAGLRIYALVNGPPQVIIALLSFWPERKTSLEAFLACDDYYKIEYILLKMFAYTVRCTRSRFKNFMKKKYWKRDD